MKYVMLVYLSIVLPLSGYEITSQNSNIVLPLLDFTIICFIIIGF